jgi:hypothetical protein
MFYKQQVQQNGRLPMAEYLKIYQTMRCNAKGSIGFTGAGRKSVFRRPPNQMGIHVTPHALRCWKPAS